MLPLREFDGWLKQVSTDDLSPLQRGTLQLVFPYFSPPDRDQVDRNVEDLRRTSQASHVVGVYTNKRRFAGDWTLTRGRYFTVAQGPDGDDGGTLGAELAAYHEHWVGPTAIEDFVPSEKAVEYGIPYQEMSILIRLSGTPGSSAVIARLQADAIWLPYRVERRRIPDVIDLRYPDVQRWFHSEFIDIHKYVAEETGVEMSSSGAGWSRPASFFEMLPVLMEPARGGNEVTELVGQWMRKRKVAALIYPSARTPAGVLWREQSMARFSGWDLVDYRGANDPFMDALTLFIGSDPWRSEYAENFDLRTGKHGTWRMFPPRGVWKYPAALTSDDDLKARFDAGKSVFNVLFQAAWVASGDGEALTPDAVSVAANTPAARKILDYMGINFVSEVRDMVGKSVVAVLFECSSVQDESGRASKGYAYLESPPVRVFDGLDQEPADYAPGQPLFSALEAGIYIYYLRDAA